MFQSLDFSHERDLTIDDVIRRVESYYPDADFDLMRRAYALAERAHTGQKRSSGEEYIIHPLNVAATLVKLRMDADSIMAGFLHDTIEDCDVKPEEIEDEVNPAVAQLVVGLTKISKINFKSKEEGQAENFRKMVVAMAKDIRVVIVKLADRMHNMRTLQYVSDEKQKKIAQETLDIYVPLASRLGINSVKSELEDLCLRFMHPDIYYRLAEKVAMKKSERDAYINDTLEVVAENLLDHGLKSEIKGRPKHFYSIYKKMTARGVDFEQIHDILAFRVIVENITECYKGLGIIHSAFTPIPGRFKDYIAIPKVNGYQSLHTMVIGPKAERIEIQIRTDEMDEVAETGVAAHWKYKEGIHSGKTKLDWVEQLLEFNQNVSNNSEFMDVVKNDLDVGGVFVFTPKGDVFELRHGATPLDFAFGVHTEVGSRCVGAKVNGKMVPLRYTLKSGDTVEVLTSKNQTPSKDWLSIVRSSRAKTKIKQYLLKVERDNHKEIGKDILEKAFRSYDTSIKSLAKTGELDKVYQVLGCSNVDELYINLGSGKNSVTQALRAVPSLKKKIVEIETDRDEKLAKIDQYSQKLNQAARRKSHKDNAVIVDGLDDIVVRIARCCNPIPGDPIKGYITRGRGITVHTVLCTRMDQAEMNRDVRVEWNPDFSFKHPVNVRVITHDKPGILSTISKTINSTGVNIRSALAKSLPDRKGSFIFEVEVKDYSELLKTIASIESHEEVISVNRV
ncbi:MAG: bifunctional (p)ppGpp synthetase/guanosine-3',5'-bis(diphosphate) 3'-pyrophosphohydrolase [Bacteriovoracaceae bacterium]|nr:bifunctional (p)ppGpp synthetase/guanosine-3',5'-bis(diphosphate) 3'-pyrophosphohydrolase [Bacteriovoracaceae bacterium]